ncbi:MAG: NAD(P)H-dependent glycerol-3-phosphate dehydrogenase [Pseudomonadota bacterium]|nr:NAD(P)H-dependent glycerol-3-phosphate dehydrogenase [Pseudomonadota bacterium]
MNNILVLGSGAWGTAVADLIANNTKKNIYLWAYEEEVARSISTNYQNKKYMPGKKLNKNILADIKLPNLHFKIIFVVIPSQFIFSFFKDFKNHFEKFNKDKHNFVICSKGIDLQRKKLLSEVVKEFFPKSNIAILSGPSFANDVLNRKPTAVTLATKSSKLAKILVDLLSNNYFRVYVSKDIIGVQINGAMKNVLAIAAGMTEGLNLGENARAAILARGIKEITRLVQAVGGKKDTVLGMSGVGDIILTCVSKSSRNYNFGVMLGKGKKIKDIINKENHTTEGVENIKVVYFLKKKHNIQMPILEAVYKILVKGYHFNKVINSLLARPLTND